MVQYEQLEEALGLGVGYGLTWVSTPTRSYGWYGGPRLTVWVVLTEFDSNGWQPYRFREPTWASGSWVRGGVGGGGWIQMQPVLLGCGVEAGYILAGVGVEHIFIWNVGLQVGLQL